MVSLWYITQQIFINSNLNAEMCAGGNSVICCMETTVSLPVKGDILILYEL